MKKIKELLKNNPFLILIFLLIVILAVVLVVVSTRRAYSGSLRIVVAPSSANILVNGKKYENGLYEGLKVGTAHVDITADGFDSESFDVDIVAGEVTKIYLCLKTDNLDLMQEVEYGDSCALVNEYNGEREKEEFLKKYPISNDIPIIVEEYSKDYTSYIYYRIDLGEYENCKSEICLKITDFSGGNYDRAIGTIIERGYNPDDYEIIYENSGKWGHA